MDDDPYVVRSLVRVLKRRGLGVATASSSEEALELLEGGLDPGVVVSDQRMAGTDGVSLLARVRKRWRKVRRILITGFTDPGLLQRAINEAQVHRFVSKPWDRDVFVQVVEDTLVDFDVLEQLEGLTDDLERKVEERSKALARAKADWLRTVDAIADPLTVISPDRVIERANRVLANATGIPIQRIVGRLCWETVVSGNGPCSGCPVPECLERSGRAEGEIRDPDSGCVYRVLAYPVIREGGSVEGIVCTYRDVTDERELQVRLLQSEKMAAVGTLAGGVAHEINNPLGGILAWTQLLMRRGGVGEEAVGYLGEIEESVLRCKTIVDSLLDFSRATPAHQRKSVDFNDVVEGAVVLAKGAFAKRGVTVDLELEDELRPVSGNKVQLQQVLVNLLSNARDASKAGGTIRVRTENDEAHVRVEVADEGCGIADKDRERVFEPFFTTKPQGEGTGLGLALSYGFIENHQGEITFETEEGVGTTFCIRLPVARTRTPFPGVTIP